MLTAHARGRICPVPLHLVDIHALTSIRQEHDISVRILGLGTETGDHEPDNALTWHFSVHILADGQGDGPQAVREPEQPQPGRRQPIRERARPLPATRR
jgi:hypothetical protein